MCRFDHPLSPRNEMTNTPLDKSNGNALMLDVSAIGGVPVVCDLCDELGNCTKAPGCAAGVLVGDGTGQVLPPVSNEERTAAGVETVDGGQEK
jgi:hypothetical protein